jgi:hypothetical protein
VTCLGQNRLQPEQTLDDDQRFVARRIADGVARALNNRRPAQIAFGTAEAPEHVFNRRWHTSDKLLDTLLEMAAEIKDAKPA